MVTSRAKKLKLPMPKITDPPILTDNVVAVHGLTRRQAARLLLTGIVAGAALPPFGAAHPVWKHLEDEHLMSRIEAAEGDGKLHFLDAHQFESLSALAEAIVPGATKANVASFIDLLLGVEDVKHRQEFVASLVAMETESHKSYGKRFSALPPTEKNEILTIASNATKTEQGQGTLRDAFENLKEWVSGGYYSSEIGMRELGWTPDRVFAEFPGCSHAERHD
jgi:hypothetical protein